MRQLPLNVRLADHAVFATFHTGANAAVVAALHDAADGRGARLLWLWGGRGSGRTHLLQASVAAARPPGAVYLPLQALGAMSTDLIEGLENLAVVAIDDVDTVAGNAAWERALLLLYERLATTSTRLVLSAAQPPGAAGLALPDLASRFATAAVFHLAALTEQDCVAALQRRAAWRGLTLPDEVAQYLLQRVERDAPSLFGSLDRLDHAALAAQRRLTVPFVRSVLDAAR